MGVGGLKIGRVEGLKIGGGRGGGSRSGRRRGGFEEVENWGS